MISTQAGTLQADGLDSDSSAISISVSTPTISYSGDSEWIIDTGATYHVCPNRRFSSFEKQYGCSVVMGNDRSCHMEGIDTILVKKLDGMMRD